MRHRDYTVHALRRSGGLPCLRRTMLGRWLGGLLSRLAISCFNSRYQPKTSSTKSHITPIPHLHILPSSLFPPPPPLSITPTGKTHRPYNKHCAQLIKHNNEKNCGWIWIGMLKFCTIAYTPNGTPQSAQRNIMVAGRPSVDLVR